MLTTDQFAESVKAKYPEYKNVDNATLAQKMIAKYPQYAEKVATTPPPTLPQQAATAVTNYGKGILDNVKAGAQHFVEGVTEAAPNGHGTGLVEGVGKILGGAAQVVTAPIAPAMAPVMKPVGAAVKIAGDKLSDTPLLQAYGRDTVSLPANVPTAPERAASTIADYANAAGTVAGFAGAPSVKAGVQTTLPKVKTAIESVGKPAQLSPQAFENSTFKNYQTAVKPTIAGKNTLAATNKYKADTVQAVQTITENKPNLKFTTEDGTIETGRTPRSRAELAQAVDQTKKSIYSQYDALAQQAGEAGVTVDGASLTGGLVDVVNNKALQLSHPEAVSYAKAKIDAYQNAGPLDTKTTQSIIENYNAELQSFHRNPSYNQASRVAIDAAIVRAAREQLDAAISSAKGPGYQQLRSQYAALKAIEADVVKSANRAARLNNKGLVDYTDIFSGGDTAAGILSLEPTLFAKGIAQHGIKEWFKYLNDPDRAITHMFQRSEVQTSRATKAILPKSTPSATANTSPINSIPASVPKKGNSASKLPPSK
jgi:hypothetical protein